MCTVSGRWGLTPHTSRVHTRCPRFILCGAVKNGRKVGHRRAADVGSRNHEHVRRSTLHPRSRPSVHLSIVGEVPREYDGARPRLAPLAT